MTYIAVDQSVHSGNAIHLFEFIIGAQTWRYTSRGEDVTALSQTWTAVPISMGGVEQTNELNKASLQLEFPRDNVFAKQFLGIAPEQVSSVTIRRGHASDAEFVVHWKGRITGSTAGDDKIRLDCESVFTSLRRPGLRPIFQKSCRFALYGPRCGVVQNTYKVTGPATSLSGTTLVVAAAASQANGWYTGGIVEAPDGSLRFIMDHSGSTLVLLRPNPGLAAAIAAGPTNVTISPGCDRLRGTCKNKFNNGNRYGGFAWMTSKNPFNGTVVF